MFGKYKTMEEWKQKNPISDKARRDLIKLCVIDDEGFEKDSLNSLNFRDIRVMDKFSDMKDLESYNVILCDIKGVGVTIDNKLEGIALARDIKKNYPEKIVIQYSSQVANDYDQFFYKDMIIDGFIDKNCSTASLAKKLDEFCSILWNPYEAWKHIEKELRYNNINNISIAYFEHLYVKSLENSNNYLESYKYKRKLSCIKKIGNGLLLLAVNIINLYLENKK